MNNNVLVVFVAVAVLGTGLALLVKPSAPINVNVTVPPQEQIYGAVTSPVIDGNFISIGGVESYYGSVGFIATSSTICSILNPWNATSSVRGIGVSRSSTGIAGTQAFYVSTTTSTGRYGSSTPAFIDNNQQGASKFAFSWSGIVSTSTPRTGVLQTLALDGSNTALLGPSEALTVRIATSSPGTFSTYMVGKCTVQLQKL